jgi:hypothetical protein
MNIVGTLWSLLGITVLTIGTMSSGGVDAPCHNGAACAPAKCPAIQPGYVVTHWLKIGDEHQCMACEPYWIGTMCEFAPPIVLAQLGLDHGLAVEAVAEGSAAAEAGVQAHDVIVSADGIPLIDCHQLVETIQDAQAAPMVLRVVRNGEPREVIVVPRAHAGGPPASYVLVVADPLGDESKWVGSVRKWLADKQPSESEVSMPFLRVAVVSHSKKRNSLESDVVTPVGNSGDEESESDATDWSDDSSTIRFVEVPLIENQVLLIPQGCCRSESPLAEPSGFGKPATSPVADSRCLAAAITYVRCEEDNIERMIKYWQSSLEALPAELDSADSDVATRRLSLTRKLARWGHMHGTLEACRAELEQLRERQELAASR